MNARAQDEMLAEECGLDYDEVTADQHPTLTKEDFIYECAQCKELSHFNDFTNTVCDDDVWGTCPKCGKHTMIFKLSNEEDVPLLD